MDTGPVAVCTVTGSTPDPDPAISTQNATSSWTSCRTHQSGGTTRQRDSINDRLNFHAAQDQQQQPHQHPLLPSHGMQQQSSTTGVCAAAEVTKEPELPSTISRYTRILIELCAGESSRLGAGGRYSEDCFVVRITIKVDFTTQRGLRVVRRALGLHFGRNVLLWVSIPCIGGSIRQRLNWAKGTDHTRMDILGYWEKFWQLWTNLEAVQPSLCKSGARIAIEWPRHCEYWTQPPSSSSLNATLCSVSISTAARSDC